MTGPDGQYRITRGPKSFYTKVQGIKVRRRFDVGRAAKKPFRRGACVSVSLSNDERKSGSGRE